MIPFRFAIGAFLLFAFCADCVSQNPSDFYKIFLKGEMGYWSLIRNAGSNNLGTRLAGYEDGRYGIHSMLWGHLAWERSPEFAVTATTDTERRQYLQTAANAIATMTSATHFKDVSNCSSVSYKGPLEV